MSTERGSAWLQVLADGPLDPAAALTLITAARSAGARGVLRTLAARTDLGEAAMQLLAADEDVWTAVIAAEGAGAGHGELVDLLAAGGAGGVLPGGAALLPARVQLAMVEALTGPDLAELAADTAVPAFVRHRALFRLITEFGDEDLPWPTKANGSSATMFAPLLPAAAQLLIAEQHGSEAALRCWARPLLARLRNGDTDSLEELTEGLWGFLNLTSSFAGWLAPQLAFRDVAVDPSVARLIERAAPAPAPELIARGAAARGNDPVVLAELTATQLAEAAQSVGSGPDDVVLEELLANPGTPVDAVLEILREPGRLITAAGLALAVHGSDERVRRAALAAVPTLLAAVPPADGERATLARELLAARRELPGIRLIDDDLIVVAVGNLRGNDLLELPADGVAGLLSGDAPPGVLQSTLRSALLTRFAADPGALLALTRLPTAGMSVAQLLDLAGTVAAPALP